MSHQPERKEKDCLNCGVTVAGRYCQVCGQENIIARQNVWGLTKHFVYDIFHFDGKFFDTLKTLCFRPGLIPREYITGKRQRYLDPIRMYLFTSAIFFLFFFKLANPVKINATTTTMGKGERLDYASRLYGNSGDSLADRKLRFLLDSSYRIVLRQPEPASNDTSFLVQLRGRDYLMVAARRTGDTFYIAPATGWLNQRATERWRAYKASFGDDSQALFKDLANNFLHKLPYIFFISLPFFALILKLLYIRRKQFFFSDHAVFTLYSYIFAFIVSLIAIFVDSLDGLLNWKAFDVLAAILFLVPIFYLLIAMKRFYVQGWGKTVAKFLLLNVASFFLLMLLMAIFVLLSIFQF
ncbi:MAG TPA: DUF3667 domain-containing protein [Flavisolibacter sp.]|nr:DUF3667 domain-containing protein [Flavisolibacter sp.]